MAIIKWAPILDQFTELEKIFDNPDCQGFAPAINMYETQDDVVIETTLAGVNSDDVKVSIENDILTIKGETKKESEVDEKNYYRKEISAGSFFRSVALPTHVVSDQAKAESKDGILRISIPKSPEVKPRTIKIDVVK